LEQYLHHYVNHMQNNWAALLPVTHFVYNITLPKNLKMSPFKINYGYALKILLTLRQAQKKQVNIKKNRQTHKIILRFI
jgi:hypothetical protein